MNAPLALPRRALRRAALLAAGVVLLALVLGLRRASDNIDDEVGAALALAGTLAQLQALPTQTDEHAMAALRAFGQQGAPRHLRLRVVDGAGQLLLDQPEPPAPAWLQPLLWLHRHLDREPEHRVVAWPLARPLGPAWTVALVASHEAERREALHDLATSVGLLLLAAALLLAAIRLNLARAFAPLQAVLQAIGRIEHGDTAAVRALPAMPVHELESVAQALRHLAQALEQAEAERRELGQRVVTLQEDERARLARELHDEFGQQLTALHVDAAWLARRLADDSAAREVAQGLVEHCRHLQRELRAVLARLRPLDDEPQDLASLGLRLTSLAQGWGGRTHDALTVQLDLPTGEQLAAAPALPAARALALYRITQEALTNVARHAQAGAVVVRLALDGDTLCWSVQDDGVGLADPDAALRRGSGLSGLRQRVWAQGAELTIGAAQPGAARLGLRLEARFALSSEVQAHSDAD